MGTIRGHVICAVVNPPEDGMPPQNCVTIESDDGIFDYPLAPDVRDVPVGCEVVATTETWHGVEYVTKVER